MDKGRRQESKGENMQRNSGVIGVEVLVGILLGGLISFFATQNHMLNKKIVEAKQPVEQIVIKNDSETAGFLRLTAPDRSGDFIFAVEYSTFIGK